MVEPSLGVGGDAAGALSALAPAHLLDGGDLDCGSGLVLLIREAMLQVPAGEVLELRSREPTVADELPPWCRMVGHAYLGWLPGEACTRYFVRSGSDEAAAREAQALAQDKARAREYEWRTRVRHSGHLQSTVYCRNLKFQVGQPASFEERDQHPSAVELLLGALGGALAVAFATECARCALELDDLELTVRGRLHDVMAHLGLEEGDPSFAAIDVRCFASSPADEGELHAAWQRTVARSPLAATLRKAVQLEIKLSII